MGLFSKRKRCPICQAGNEVALDAQVDAGGLVAIVFPFVKATCKTCEYKFMFGWLSLFLGTGWTLFIVLLMGNPPIKVPLVCVVSFLVYLAVGIIGFFTIVHSQFFDRYLDRLIIKKAKKLVRKDEKHSWTGSFLNEEMRARVKRWMDEGGRRRP